MPVSHSYRKTFQCFLGVPEAICLHDTYGKDSKIAHPSSLGDSSWDRRFPAGQRDLLRTPHILISSAERETDPVRIQYYCLFGKVSHFRHIQTLTALFPLTLLKASTQLFSNLFRQEVKSLSTHFKSFCILYSWYQPMRNEVLGQKPSCQKPPNYVWLKFICEKRGPQFPLILLKLRLK